jgi:cardiolipin synthase
MKKTREPRPRIPWRQYPWWVRTFSIIGVLAVGGVLTALFVGLGHGPHEVSATSIPPVESRDFLLGVSGIAGVPLREGGTARLLNNGDEFFPALLRTIRGATRVQVRVLLDGFGGAKAPKAGMDALRAAGGKVETFRAPRLGRFTRFHKRNHRRAIVIDGTVGYTGGIAVGDQWLGDAESEEHWRDSMVEVTGPLAATLQSAFADLWAGTSGELLLGPAFFPPPESAVPRGERITAHVGLASSPYYESRPLRFFFIQSFLAARKRLWITTPYFVPDEATRKAVASRAKAGVDVRILMPDHHTDADVIRLASHHYYGELMEAGVRIYEYQHTMMHAKQAVVDGQWSVVGSANMDIRGNALNEENVLGILDAEFGRQMEETFLRDLERSKEFHLDEWRRRWWERPASWVATLFAQQY